jgi:hypothetical protein
MGGFWRWWHGLPESYRTAVITGVVVGVVALVGWLSSRMVPSMITWWKRRNLERTSAAIISLIKRQGGTQGGYVRKEEIPEAIGETPKRVLASLDQLERDGRIAEINGRIHLHGKAEFPWRR